MKTNHAFLAFFFTLLVSPVICAQSDFRVYSALFYKNQPDLEQFGLKSLLVTGNIWPNNKAADEPDESTVRNFARQLIAQGKDKVCIDIEHWPMYPPGTTPEVPGGVEVTTDKFLKVADWMHSEAPGVSIGFYAYPPIRDYWTPGYFYSKDPATLARWRERNDLLSRLAEKVDIIFPSLYTFYDLAPPGSLDGWKKYAIANIEEAKQYGKPVYPIIWPQYHDSNKTVGGNHIPGPSWREQLETILDHADGVVIWGGWQLEWNPNAEWWLATLDFIRDHGLNKLPAPELLLKQSD